MREKNTQGVISLGRTPRSAIWPHSLHNNSPSTTVDDRLETMKLKISNIKIKSKRRKGRLEPEPVATYKCLLLGPNQAATETFLRELGGGRGGGQLLGNEVVLATKKGPVMFWRPGDGLQQGDRCLKQYLDFQDPDAVFYFVSYGERSSHLDLFQVVDMVKDKARKICIVLDEESVDGFQEEVKQFSGENDFSFQKCLVNLESITAAVEAMVVGDEARKGGVWGDVSVENRFPQKTLEDGQEEEEEDEEGEDDIKYDESESEDDIKDDESESEEEDASASEDSL